MHFVMQLIDHDKSLCIILICFVRSLLCIYKHNSFSVAFLALRAYMLPNFKQEMNASDLETDCVYNGNLKHVKKFT